MDGWFIQAARSGVAHTIYKIKRKEIDMIKKIAFTLWMALSACAFAATPMDDAVAELQREWEVVRYQVPAADKLGRWEALASKAHRVSAQYPSQSEPLIWEGIIVSTWAGDKGGLGALGLVKDAKKMYEKAIEMNPQALDGSAYNSLGVLYFKVPGWPVGFGDKDKAKTLLEKALQINPQGIDPNFFYAEYLIETKQPQAALTYLEKALNAPARAGRQIADAGRKDEVIALMKKTKQAIANQ
jgi:tetratricopeptide (TPR) repeat protein